MTTLIQYHTDKFIKSLAGNIENNILSNIDGVLYSLYFQYNFDNVVFVVDGKISTEVNNFIIEFQEAKNIILYYVNNTDDYSQTFKYVKHITRNGLSLKGKHLELPEIIVDTKIFTTTNKETRKDKYCVFLNHAKSLPDDLSCLLYPNTSIPINMFDSPYIPHAQNLGIVTSELEKSKILNRYKYFIDIDQQYGYEAYLCGCTLVSIDCNKNINNVSVDKNKIVSLSNIIKEIL
tara:strand:+ start:1438 stop:2139 length:702 start_codon:yes stop_codon:yes gene_type:complete